MGSISFRRLFHWGPISVLGIIKLIAWTMVHVLGMWWPPHASVAGALHAALFLALAGSTLYYFLASLIEGPGFVPLGWKPENEKDEQYLQFCTVCQGYKAPRAHHCRKCGYCVLKMDHHCPWINCCVGHSNHAYFTLFLTSAVLGCLHASIVLPICVYHGLNRAWYVRHGGGPFVHFTLTTLVLTLLAIGMAVGVVLAVSALLFFQLRGIYRNETTIEEWILQKAHSRHAENNLPPFVYPYDLGWRNNFRLVLWTKMDGVRWPVREGCGEYDLTIEQQLQKDEKRQRSRLYVAQRPYGGSRCPLSRPRAAVAAPCTDEGRLPLGVGDMVRATRHRRYWLFGEKLPVAEGGRGERGWFPRDSVVLAESLKRD